MRQIHLSLLSIAALAILCLPHTTHAYYTTAQSAQVATPTTGLYTVTYEFGMAHQDVVMPILATRGLTFQQHTQSFRVGYQLETVSGTPVTVGQTTALVLSKVPIVSNMYRIPAGQVGYMTLVVLVKLPAGTPPSMYRLHVTKLPFTFSDAQHPNDLEELNNFELSHYVTPAIPLGSTGPIAPVPNTPSAATTPAAQPKSTATTNPNFHW